VETNVSLPQ
jgi:hypothetical protein